MIRDVNMAKQDKREEDKKKREEVKIRAILIMALVLFTLLLFMDSSPGMSPNPSSTTTIYNGTGSGAYEGNMIPGTPSFTVNPINITPTSTMMPSPDIFSSTTTTMWTTTTWQNQSCPYSWSCTGAINMNATLSIPNTNMDPGASLYTYIPVMTNNAILVRFIMKYAPVALQYPPGQGILCKGCDSIYTLIGQLQYATVGLALVNSNSNFSYYEGQV